MNYPEDEAQERVWRLALRLEATEAALTDLMFALSLLARPDKAGVGPDVDVRRAVAAVLSSGPIQDWPHDLGFGRLWVLGVMGHPRLEFVERVPGSESHWQRSREDEIIVVRAQGDKEQLLVEITGKGPFWTDYDGVEMKQVAAWARLLLALLQPTSITAQPAALSAGVEGMNSDCAIFDELGSRLKFYAATIGSLGWLPVAEQELAVWAGAHVDAASARLKEAQHPSAYGRWAGSVLLAVYQASQSPEPRMVLKHRQWAPVETARMGTLEDAK